MAYCISCGVEIADGAKFCHKCGSPVASGNVKNENVRQQEFVGKIYKCPNCGEVLKSFVSNCPSCGFELRGTKATSAVKEFATKLEAIEARREYEKPGGFFKQAAALQHISKTDEQKINLIQSFSVPNTKEDILEFMILATSNVNYRSYDSTRTNTSKSDTALSDAWISKIKQVYEKGKASYGGDQDFNRIQGLYDSCISNIKKSKKQGVFKWILMFGWMPLFFILIFTVLAIKAPAAAEKESARLNAIEQIVIESIDNQEYKKALLNAEALIYTPSIRNGDSDEIERQWDVKRKLLIDEILEDAKKNGVELEYTPSENIDDANKDTSTTSSNGGFVEGFQEGAQPGLEAAKENIDEFNRIMNGDNTESSSSQKGE